MGHLLSHKQNNLAVLFVGFAQQAAKLKHIQKLNTRLYATTAEPVRWRNKEIARVRAPRRMSQLTRTAG